MLHRFKTFVLCLNLSTFSILYLSVPIIIFFVFWLKPFIIGILLPVLLFALYRSLKKSLSKKPFVFIKKDFSVFHILNFVLILSVLLAWFSFSGVGGMGLQTGDYEKHNSMIYDLVNNEWPVVYTIDNQTRPLVYYLAYYLPSAILGKVFGLDFAIQFMILWAFLGLVLSILWFFKFTKVSSVFSLLIFIFFGGIDILGKVFITNQTPLDLNIMSIWPGGLQLSGNTIALYWVPQHALAAWIGTSLVYDALVKKSYSDIFFRISFIVLWSPFVFLGLLPFLILARKSIRQAISFENFSGLIIAFILILFLYTPNKDLMTGWIWEFFAPLALVLFLISYYIFGFIIWFALLNKKAIFEKFDNDLIGIVFCILILVPIYWIGYNDDFAMRTNLPAVFILCIFVTRSLYAKNDFDKKLDSKNYNINFLRKSLIIFFLVLASVSGFVEITRSVTYPEEKYEYKTLTRLSGGNKDLVLYIGKKDTIFFNYLGK